MLVLAHAKINLTLDVLGSRPGGYHDIASVLQTISLHDTLDVRLTDAPGRVELIVEGEAAAVAEVPADAANIAHRAAARLLERTGRDAAVGARLRLTKRIPAQAGLGGGSSDAAAALRAVNELLGWPLDAAALGEVAASLGSDVPFFLYGGTCLVEGRGERVTRRAPLPTTWGLIVKPPAGIVTALAYRALDDLRGPGYQPPDAPPAWDGQTLRNDFDAVAAALEPGVLAARRALARSGLTRTLLCGSGSAVLGLLPAADPLAAPGAPPPAVMQRLHDAARQVRGQGVGDIYLFRTLAASEIANA